MSKVRVHELAKEFDMPSKDMVAKMQAMGLDVKNHMSTVETSQADWVRRKLSPNPPSGKATSAHTPDTRSRQDKTNDQPTGKPPARTNRGEQPPANVSGDEKPRGDRPSERQQPVAGNNAVTDKRPVSPGNEQVGRRPQGQPGQGYGDRRPQGQPGQGYGDRRPQGQPGQGYGDRRPQGQPGQGYGDRRPQGQPGQGYGDRRPQGQPGQGYGDRRPQGQPGQGYGDRRPQGQPGQGYGDRRPQGQPGQGYGDRRPQGQPGQGYGDRRPQGQPGQGYGDRRPQGQPGQGYGDRRPQGQPGQGYGDRRPQGQPGQGYGDRRPQGPGQGPRPPRMVVPPAPVTEDKPRKTGPPAKDKEKDTRRMQEKKAHSDKEITRILDDNARRAKGRGKKRSSNKEENGVTPETITILDQITVRELAEQLNKNPAELVKKLFNLGIMATVNQDIEYEVAEILASDYDVKVERGQTEEERLMEEIVDDPEELKPRPPVVTVMGHVDHGKTSLLDALRETNVVAGEAGGITQHIGAYQVEIKGNRITFIDTPGHEAFTAMRLRGAMATDIAILVVAADDGVMPQTIEAISHAKAAEVPIIVAVNKIDRENADPNRVKQQLAEHGLVPEDWGGETICVPVSAKTRIGLEHLLEMILLVAEMKDIKANPNRRAEGVVLEGQLDKGKGPVASVLVQKGTLRVGDTLICGNTWGKVRAMFDEKGRRVTEALPSMPVEVQGINDVPMAGDAFRAVDDKVAKQVAELRQADKKREEQAKTARVSLDDFFKQMGESKELNLLVKGDVQGSVEAMCQSLTRLSTDEVKVNVIHSGVGAVTESDVMLASASNGIIIGFNVRPDTKARKAAENEGIDVRLYRVIYEALDDVKKAMTGLLEPEHREVFQGSAEVRATFKVPKAGMVAGAYVTEGKITRQSNVRVVRDGIIVYEGKLASLRRFKDDAKEVVAGYECGIGIDDFNDIKEGDTIEAFTIEDVPREL